MATRKRPARTRKSPERKKIVIRVELPPVTKAQREALGELFETAALAVLGVPPAANVNKQAVVARGGRRPRR